MNGTDVDLDLGTTLSGTKTINELKPNTEYNDWSLNLQYKNQSGKINTLTKTIDPFKTQKRINSPLVDNTYIRSSFMTDPDSITSNSFEFSIEILSRNEANPFDADNVMLKSNEDELIVNPIDVSYLDSNSFRFEVSNLKANTLYSNLKLSVNNGIIWVNISEEIQTLLAPSNSDTILVYILLGVLLLIILLAFLFWFLKWWDQKTLKENEI